MTIVIRIALAILFLNELIVGAWNQFFPRSFYDTFPTVDLTPPFSEHYARDFGGATLGIAVLLGIALVTAKASWILPATIAYTVFSIPHFVFHAARLEHDARRGRVPADRQRGCRPARPSRPRAHAAARSPQPAFCTRTLTSNATMTVLNPNAMRLFSDTMLRIGVLVMVTSAVENVVPTCTAR
jgi:hypothetical protein